MTVLGAPFEADAQLVKLQFQGLIDCILSQDGDIMLLGGTMIQFGKCEHLPSHRSYNSRTDHNHC